MGDRQYKMSLEVPKPRKSVELTGHIRRKSATDMTLSSMESPQATSTVERYGCESLTGFHSINYIDKSRKRELDTCESSLGILDIDNCRGLGEDELENSNLQKKSIHSKKSISFNPREITGRSTHARDDFKENKNPQERQRDEKKSSPKLNNTCSFVNDIIEKAKIQSAAVDKILTSSNDPEVLKLHNSLQSFKYSLSSGKMPNMMNDSWNYRAQDFKSSVPGNDSCLRDSLFESASKIDMSKEELSWIKENGEIPVCPKTSLLNSTNSLYDYSIPIDTQLDIDDKEKSRAECTNLKNNSKMSVGFYFGKRCNNIKDILNTTSPEKTASSNPLYLSDINPETLSKTYEIKIQKDKISESSVNIPPAVDLSLYKTKSNAVETDFKIPSTNACPAPVDSTNVNDTLSSALSLTQIRNMVGKLDERPSILLDHMLGIKSENQRNEKKTKLSKNTLYPSPGVSKFNHVTINEMSPSSVTNSFVCASNIFHSTKNDDCQVNLKSNTLSILKTPHECEDGLSDSTHSHNKFSPIKIMKESNSRDPRGLSNTNTNSIKINNSMSQHNISSGLKKASIQNKGNSLSILHDTNNPDFTSMSKNSRISTTDSSSGYTDNTVKSVSTVVNIKSSACLNPILEDDMLDCPETEKDPKEAKDDNNFIKKDARKMSLEMSPGVMSISHDKISQGVLTPSDVSKEIKDLMSPASGSDNEKVFNTPSSGRHVKRLLDHYNTKSQPVNSNGWISPLQTRLNNISKECIPALTPFRINHIESQSHFANSSPNENDANMLNISDVAENSLNVPIKGDWLKVESSEEEAFIGVTHDLKIRMESLSSRWLSVEFSVKTVCINDKLYDDDIKKVVILQAPVTKILLKADSKSECILKLVTLMADVNISIKIHLLLTDIVTKCSSFVEHIIRVKSQAPKLSMQSIDANIIKSVEFTAVPEQCESYMPFVLWNESHMDLLITFNINCTILNVFNVVSVETVLEDEVNNSQLSRTLSSSRTKDNVSIKDEVYSLPKGRKSALLIIVQFVAPKLESTDVTIQHIDGILNICLVLSTQKNASSISIQSVPIYGSVGISTLLIRNGQKTSTLIVSQGSTEDVEMFNAGSITTEYKLYIASYSDKNSKNFIIAPCENGLFILDKSSIILHPGEKAHVKVMYPLCDTLNDNIKRLLAFESLYTTEVIDIVGTLPSRCHSQQSAYSVESSSTNSQVTIKSTKKELSWGSTKIGEAKVQDVTFKNVSVAKKLRVIVTLLGEGFKVISDSGSATSMMLTLQPQECRALKVEFRATHLGGHTGTLRIAKRYNPSSDINEARALFKIPLHGVGGQSTFIFRDGVFKHAGAQGLPLGSLNNSGLTKEIFFTIWNKGTVPGFVLFNIDLKWKYRSLGNEVYITPQQSIIPPGTAVRCAVSIPRRAILLTRGQLGDTEVVASLTVFHGDESIRLRIKKICSDFTSKEFNFESLNENSQGKLNKLCSRFTGEDANYGNICSFKETPVVLKQLLDELQQKEVMLTYDLDLDYSIAVHSSDSDETLQFHSICDDDSSNVTLISEPKM